MRRLLVVPLLLLVAAACGSNAGDDDPIVATDDTTTSTSAGSGTTTTTTEPTTPGTTPGATPVRDPEQRYRVATTVLESPDHGPQLCLGGVAESYPPQCGGPDIEGWSWEDVEGEESANGTTWGAFTAIGTFDGATFTLTERPGPFAPRDTGPEHDYSPACDDPDGDEGADPTTFVQPEDPDVAAVWVSDPAGEWDGPLVYSVVVRPGAADRIRALVRESWSGLLCVVERDQPGREELRALQARVHDEAADSPLGGVFGSGVDELRGVVVIGCAIADEVSVAWARDRWGPDVVLDGALDPVD